MIDGWQSPSKSPMGTASVSTDAGFSFPDSLSTIDEGKRVSGAVSRWTQVPYASFKAAAADESVADTGANFGGVIGFTIFDSHVVARDERPFALYTAPKSVQSDTFEST